MLKFLETSVVFTEIPDEITLAVNITNCPFRCKDCHSPWLQTDIGEDLTTNIFHLIDKYPYITTVSFMGGDADHEGIAKLATLIKKETGLKVAMYSGNNEIDPILVKVLDYYKVGAWNRELGPLSSPTTNQRLYRIINQIVLEDITFLFWTKN